VGRHSSRDRWPYLRSVVGYALPWAVIAAIVGIAVWLAVGAVGGDPVSVGEASSDTSPSAEPTPSATPTPAPSGSPEDGEVDGSEDPAGKDEPEEKPIGTPKDDLITEGIGVQVLNGTGGVEGAAEAMANRLTRLGYEIYAINTGLTIDRTTVYWSSEAGRAAAIPLSARFGWDVGAAPPSLSSEVDIAVVVGPDETNG
jgi:hypothetical protein